MAITRKYRVELAPDSFRRLDDSEDRAFFEGLDPSTRFVEAARSAVRPVLRTMVTTSEPAILDIMAGSDSLIAGGVEASSVVGVGPSGPAMHVNSELSERLDRDLNADPRLPFEDGRFDVVMCTGAIQYMTRPVEVFAEAARVLKPGGLFLVVFDTIFEEKRATKIWRRSSDEERLALVAHLIELIGAFDQPQVRVTKVWEEVQTDLDAGPEQRARPVFAVFVGRSKEGSVQTSEVQLMPKVEHRYSPEEIATRKRAVSETMRCPYCDVPLTKFKVPDAPFCEWDAEHLWVCFAEDCTYTARSLAVMAEQGNLGVSYRVVYHKERDHIYSIPDVGFGDSG